MSPFDRMQDAYRNAVAWGFRKGLLSLKESEPITNQFVQRMKRIGLRERRNK